MKKSIFRLYVIFISIIFAFALLFLGINIFNEMSHGQARTKRRYEHIVNTLEKDLSKKSIFKNNYFENLLGDKQDFSYFCITNNGQIIFSYPENLTQQDIDNAKSTNIITKYHTIYKLNDNNYTIQASLFVLRPSQIYYFSKISFIIILIGTIITAILIFYLGMQENTNSTIYAEKVEDKKESLEQYEYSIDELIPQSTFDVTKPNLDETTTKTTTNISTTTSISKENDSLENKESISESNSTVENTETSAESDITENKIETSIPQTDTSSNNNEYLSQEEPSLDKISAESESSQEIIDTQNKEAENTSENDEKDSSFDNPTETSVELSTEKPAAKASLPVEEIIPMELDDISEAPTGLFSPTTGIGWESYLLTRLDNELNRATASEVDLSLFTIRIPNVARTDYLMREICDYLTIQFQFKDLLFEYKDDCIVAIKISINIDEALSLAEKLQDDINNILKDKNISCYIGISSRSVRMIAGERLIKEADQALQHAQVDDDSRIIAFRVDPTKYQKFLEEQNKSKLK